MLRTLACRSADLDAESGRLWIIMLVHEVLIAIQLLPPHGLAFQCVMFDPDSYDGLTSDAKRYRSAHAVSVPSITVLFTEGNRCLRRAYTHALLQGCRGSSHKIGIIERDLDAALAAPKEMSQHGQIIVTDATSKIRTWMREIGVEKFLGYVDFLINNAGRLFAF